jgi:hypothetical protein
MRTVILEFVTMAFWLVSHKRRRFGARMRLEFEARKIEAPNMLGSPGGTAKTLCNNYICFVDTSLCEHKKWRSIYIYVCAVCMSTSAPNKAFTFILVYIPLPI